MGVSTIARYTSLIFGIMTITAGIIHLVNSFDTWCHKSDAQDCVGPSLFWNDKNGKSFTSDVNGPPYVNGANWRSVFTFVPDIFFDLWTPTILGFIVFMLHVRDLKWQAVSENWVRMCVFQLVVVLWGAFGYAGNFGIITGFVGVLAAFLALLSAMLDSGGQTTCDLTVPLLK